MEAREWKWVTKMKPEEIRQVLLDNAILVKYKNFNKRPTSKKTMIRKNIKKRVTIQSYVFLSSTIL
jgi:hypothetical protein